MKSLIIPIKTNNNVKAKIKLICNHLNIHNQNELNTIQAIYNLFTKTMQYKDIQGRLNPTQYINKQPLTDLLTTGIVKPNYNNSQQVTHQNDTWEQPQNPTNSKPQSTQKLPFKNNQSTQNQIISQIIHILPEQKAKQLTNSAINMIINRLHKKGALIRIGGYYSLIPAFNDLESKEQIVFRFEKG